MSLNVGTLVEFHSAMTCPQTTHFAVLSLSREGRELRHRIKRSATRAKEGVAFRDWPCKRHGGLP
jgi:hypothetical protein